MWHLNLPKFQQSYNQYSMLKVLRYFIRKINRRDKVFMFYSQLWGCAGLLNGYECRLVFKTPWLWSFEDHGSKPRRTIEFQVAFVIFALSQSSQDLCWRYRWAFNCMLPYNTYNKTNDLVNLWGVFFYLFISHLNKQTKNPKYFHWIFILIL